MASLVPYFKREFDRFTAQPEAAKALLGAEAEAAEPAVRAALTMVGNVLLSLDATLTKE
jgi:hypothetical protein